MSDKTLLSLIPGFDDAMTSAGHALGGILPSVKGNDHLNTQSIVLYVIVLGLIFALTFMGSGKLANTKEAIIPDEKLSARTFWELLLDTVMGLMEDVMGAKNAKRFMPLIGTCAVVILFSNLFGLMPGFAPPTDNLNLTFAMASVIFVATHVVGIQTNGVGHIAHMANPIGTWWGWFLAPLFLPIEIIGHVVRPVSLSLRLMCNMIGDHKVLAIFLSLIAVPLVYPVPIILLGTIVCIVQTAVFCLLSMVYVSMALEEHDHGHEEHH